MNGGRGNARGPLEDGTGVPGPLRSLTFRVDGHVPNKTNYRRRSAKPGGKQEADRAWARVKHFEELVGWRCRQAARPGQLARLYGRPLEVEVALYGQRTDPDGALKALLDALEGILWPDDSARHVRRVEVLVGDEGVFEGPCAVVRVAPWE